MEKGLGTSNIPKENTELESQILYLKAKLEQMSKAIQYNKDQFRQLDQVANRLNPDSYWRNIPVCDSSCGADKCDGEPYVQSKSGHLLEIESVINLIESLTKDLDNFTSYEINQTVNFFLKQI